MGDSVLSLSLFVLGIRLAADADNHLSPAVSAAEDEAIGANFLGGGADFHGRG